LGKGAAEAGVCIREMRVFCEYERYFVGYTGLYLPFEQGASEYKMGLRQMGIF